MNICFVGDDIKIAVDMIWVDKIIRDDNEYYTTIIDFWDGWDSLCVTKIAVI